MSLDKARLGWQKDVFGNEHPVEPDAPRIAERPRLFLEPDDLTYGGTVHQDALLDADATLEGGGER